MPSIKEWPADNVESADRVAYPLRQERSATCASRACDLERAVLHDAGADTQLSAVLEEAGAGLVEVHAREDACA